MEASIEAVSLMCDCEVLKLVFYVGFCVSKRVFWRMGGDCALG